MKTLEQAFLERGKLEREQKRKQWEEIQTKAPDVAKFMVDFSRVFGKFKQIEVRLRDE